METEMSRDLRMRPRAAVVMPLPTELTTPPVTKMYFGICSSRRWGPAITQRRHFGECRPPAILAEAPGLDKIERPCAAAPPLDLRCESCAALTAPDLHPRALGRREDDGRAGAPAGHRLQA